MSASTTRLPFQSITPYLAVGAQSTAGWRSIASYPLVILVGVTGVGKSTLLNGMAQHGAPYLLLPDRRQLTDRLIIATMQAADGTPVTPITDRGQRFAYTRRYRELYKGGMAHALTQLWIGEAAPNLLVFDGLRGANEVTHAAAVLPQARFVMLDAPDLVRLQRLLGRGDAFDHITVTSQSAGNGTNFAELGMAEAATIFNAADEAIILSWIQQGIVTIDELRAKLQIVIEERRSYDPAATLEALQIHAPQATVYIDTMKYGPPDVARQTLEWLKL